MREEKFLRLNTVFQLPREVAQAAINLSSDISENHETFFTLDGVQVFPHITIYSPEYPVSNLDKVISAVGEVAESVKQIEFTVKAITVYQDFITVSLEVSPAIQEIHEKVVNKLNSLRGGKIKEKYQQGPYSPEQQENIRKYGYPNVLDLYHPHITITRLKDVGAVKEIANNLKWEASKFIIDKIAVYKMGQHGTCVELVKGFNLSG